MCFIALVLLILVIVFCKIIFLIAKKFYRYNLQLMVSVEKVSCVWIKGWKLVILTGRSLYIEELVIHKTADLGWPKPVLCCTVLHILPGLQAVLCHTHPSATG